jgi:hypothetical protein
MLLLIVMPQQRYNETPVKSATVYFYQTSRVPGSTAVSVDVDAVCRLQAGSYCKVQIEPGKHMFATNREYWGNSFDVQAAGTYYFRLHVSAVGGGYVANLTAVNADTARHELRVCTKTEAK